MLLCGAQALWAEGALAGPCDPPANAIVCENSKPGNSADEWDVEQGGDPDIQGFATDISVNRGQTVRFKIKTDSTDYHLDIYRMGYYGGDGARKVATVNPSVSLPQKQPTCKAELSTGLIDCGTWSQSAVWPVPATAVSGIYFAKLVREDQPSDGSHIVFVVRDDASHSDILFQTSDTTWEAYNQWGGNSLYVGDPGIAPSRAYKVSYNRPLTVRGPSPEDSPFSAEYPMVRWLERNGYDVSYFTGVDADRRGEEIQDHSTYLSVGHDEYWSGPQRENVEAARDAGVNLAFFSGNEIFWKTRWEDSIGGMDTDHRTLVSFKETHANEKIDPEEDVWTGTWRDPRFSPPADGGRPENALTGTIFTVNQGTAAIEVPAADGKLRLWRGTGLSSLGSGKTATLGEDTLGYEWDEDLDNGFRPPGLMDLSTTTVEVPQKLLDFGSNYGPGTATHHVTLYRAPSGALVFGAGTVQWSWGLDGEHDREETTPDSRMQQATVNLFADMGVQPESLQGDLGRATQTTDDDPPTTTITAPGPAAEVESGAPTTISGSANDITGETAGGQVAGVEVSTNGGDSWHPAEGREHWSYKWTPGKVGSTTVMARAVDDSGNLEQPGDSAVVQIAPHTCPCSIWDDSFSAEEDSESDQIEVGVKFRSETPGYITGLRFYKTPGNTGTHVGHLWTLGGEMLAEVTFTGETGSGWQQVDLPTPVPIDPNTTYVASYHAPNGHYAARNDYFALVGAESSPLQALADGVDGPNGIYALGPSGALFANGEPNSYQASNYMTDVVFEEEVAADTTPPTVSTTTPGAGAVDFNPKTNVLARFSENMEQSTLNAATVELRDAGGAPVATAISYQPGQRQLTIEPAERLTYSTTYTVTIKGGSVGAADLAGNRLASDFSWSFTTAPPPPPPPDQGSGGPILVISNADNPFSHYYAEILRAEGLNEFSNADIASVSPAVLSEYDVVILGEGPLSEAEAQMLSDWVQQGGNLIAMRPDPELAGLLGISSAGGTLSDAYLKVDTGTAPGTGIVGQTIQFHGAADRYLPTAAATIATLYADAGTPTSNPAVTLRSVGSKGGQAAAFSYDLAKSVVYTRQGNPAWAGEERDGASPIRSDDLFFGGKPGNAQSDWVDLNKVQIPQADEQQRLLTNLIERMNQDRKPLPRFWFLPHDKRAAIVMTGDDHGNGGTVGRFEQYEEESPPGCVVEEWECVRSTSYIYPNTPIANSQATAFTTAGFEIGLHAMTSCSDWGSEEELEEVYSTQLQQLAANFPGLPAPSTERTHCIVWSDWASQPKVEVENGIRLDTNYYYWPDAWVQNRPGMFTGSGMPMRFADLDGSMIDVYQAATQMTDESEQDYPFTVDTLLDNALGSNGYYGVFTVNMHTDVPQEAGSDAIVASAQARGVPIVSAKQMLTWLDGRNRSSFGSIEWSGNRLGFTISRGGGANGLRAMVPVGSSVGDLGAIERDGEAIPTTVETIKGIQYAFFDAEPGSYAATYSDHVPPAISDVAASAHEDGTATISWSSDEPSDSRVDYGTSPSMLTSSSSSPTLVESHSIELTGLIPGVTYYYRVTSADTSANSTTDPAILLSPLSFTSPIPVDTTAPTATIGDHPADPSKSAAASFTFAGSDGAADAFQCRLDSAAEGDWEACSSPQPYSALAEGPHSFEVRATDPADNTGAAASFAWRVDTTAPTVTIDSGPDGPTKQVKPTFSFHASEPGAAFECSIDTGTADFGPCSEAGSETPESALAEGPHSFRVRATDAAGNAGAVALQQFAVDTTAPTATIGDHPADPSKSAAASFTFAGSDGAADAFQCRLDSAAEGDWEACSSPQPYSALAEGPHSFEVRATDPADNTGAAASFAWRVDTTAPTVTIDSGPDGPTKQVKPTFSFHASEPGAAFECSIDTGTADFGPCSEAGSETPESALAEGPHSFRVRATDAAGNAGAVALQQFAVDTTAPTATIGDHPADPSKSAAASFTFAGSDGAADAFQCRLDSAAEGDWEACSSPQPYSALAEGPHSFEVRATDPADNTGAAASFAWRVDTTAPTVTIDSGPDGPTKQVKPTFSFHASEPGAAFECSIDTGTADFGPCSEAGSETPESALAEGPHSFRVRATDAAGNAGAVALQQFAVDTTAPTATIGDHPADPSKSAAASFTFAGSDGAADAFQCRLDSAAEGDWEACSSPQPYSALAEGPHSFEVRATDPADNTGAAASFAWRVDTTAPTVTIDSGPDGPTKQVKPTFSFHASEPGAAFECSIDTGTADFGPCSEAGSETPESALAEGPHSFRVRATDAAGNAGAVALQQFAVDTTAPTATIGDHPADPSKSAAASFTFAGSDGAADAFQCRLDSAAEGDWEACSSPQPYSALAEGPHSFEVRATDPADNTGAAASFAWRVDTTAPTVTIDSGPDGPTKQVKPTFSFHASEPGAAFECSIDTGTADFGPCSEAGSETPESALAEGPHSFRVRATDAAGNAGAVALQQFAVDTTAPTATIGDHPADPSKSAAASFTFAGSDGAADAFQCRLDSAAEGDWEACSSPQPYSALAEGPHSFEVRATDPADNTGAAASFAWRVDTTAPTVTIDSGPDGPTKQVKPTFSFHASEPGAAFECSIDTGTADFGPCSEAGSETPESALAEGPHSFRVRATDAAGNAGAVALQQFAVDTTAPTATIGDHPADPSKSAAASFTFAGSDGAADAFQCRLDSAAEGDWEACSSPQPYSALAEGPHSFEVRATDPADNTGAAASFAWRVDTTAPTVTIDSGPDGPTKQVKPTFSFHASEPGAAFECSIDTGTADFGPCSEAGSETPESALAEGPHSFRVRATDAAGNAGAVALQQFAVDTTAPTATIGDHPADPSKSAAASFTFAGSDGAADAFQCRLDSAAEGDWEACSSPQPYSALAEGPHSFEVRATDPADNTGAAASFAWRVDTTAPTVTIDSGPDGPTKQVKPTFSFHASEPGAAFECSIDTGTADFGPCSEAGSETPESALAEGPHSFRVRATDAAGNAGAVALQQFAVDTTAPTATIGDHPADPSKSAAASFTFAGSDGAADAFQCRLDSAAEGDWEACSSPQPYSALAEGPHSFEVRATDPADNTGAAASFAWRVDTTAPTVTIDSGPDGPTKQVKPTFSFHASEPGAAFECSIDTGTADFGPCSEAGSETPESALAEGPHSFRVRATDAAGNAGAVALQQFAVDTTAPTATIGDHPASLTNSANAKFEFNGADVPGSGIASFECRRDNGAWNDCASPQDYSSLADGAHSFEVRAIDNAGNVDASPASFAWTVDTTAPTTQIDSSPPALTSSPAANFSFSGSDTPGSGVKAFECRRDNGAWNDCASPQDYTSLADGPHSFEVRATDNAGNVDATPASFDWTVDTALPSPPVLSATAPASPANENSPKVLGSAPAGSTIRIYATSDCTGPPLASGSAADLAAGIEVTVADDSSNALRATATSAANNTSPCSTPIAYVEDSTAPETQIHLEPPALTNSASAEFGFSGADPSGSGIASFQCKADDGDWTACDSPQDYSSLSDGNHSFEVRAIDSAGNVDNTPASFSWTVDTTVPTVSVDSLSTALLGVGESAELRWHAGENGAFELRLGAADCTSGAVLASGSYAGAPAQRSTPVAAADLSEGVNSLRLCLTDSASNRGSATVVLAKDTTAPDTEISDHPAALTSSASANFVFSGADNSGSGIASFQCRRDDGDWVACDSPQTYSSLADGPHSFEVRATDNAGNIDATPASFDWTVDTALPSPPVLSATAPASPANENSPKVLGSAPAGSTIRIYATSDCTGPPLASGSAADLAAGIEVTVADDSSNALRATATSAANNTSPCSAPIAYVEDSTAPETQIHLEPPALTNSASAEFGFSGADLSGSGIASFQCRRDDGDWSDCTSPQTYTSLADGAHEFEVKAVDNAGNVDATPASTGWTVDTTSPRDGASTPPPGPVVTPSVNLPENVNAFVRFVAVKYKRATLFMILAVSGPGTLSASPPKAPPAPRAGKLGTKSTAKAPPQRIEAESIRADEAGQVKLPIKLTALGRRLLRQRNLLRIPVELNFESPDGLSASRRMTIVLKRKPRLARAN